MPARPHDAAEWEQDDPGPEHDERDPEDEQPVVGERPALEEQQQAARSEEHGRPDEEVAETSYSLYEVGFRRSRTRRRRACPRARR